MRPAPDATIGEGRYRLQRRLGAGGMASVWLAVDERLGRPVAVKIVADTLADDDRWVRRFQREAQAAAALSHRGVVPVFDYGVQDGRPFLVMEYIPGGTLADRLAEGAGNLPDAAGVARELLEALAAVHSAGILHRDIKPGNLLLDGHGHIRLTDFGIAQAQDGSALTRTGMVIGTLRYLAPEVAAGGRASAQSDLYAAGVVIRQLAAARPAPGVAGLVAALTAEDPRQRPASASEALALLGEPGIGAAPTRVPEDDGTAATRVRETNVTRRLAPAPPAPRLRPHPRRAGRPCDRAPGAAGTHEPTPTAGILGPPPNLAAALLTPDATALLRRPAALAVAGIAALAVIVVIVVLAASGGGSGGSARPPAPAPAGSSVARQVQALDRIVSGAAQR